MSKPTDSRQKQPKPSNQNQNQEQILLLPPDQPVNVIRKAEESFDQDYQDAEPKWLKKARIIKPSISEVKLALKFTRQQLYIKRVITNNGWLVAYHLRTKDIFGKEVLALLCEYWWNSSENAVTMRGPFNISSLDVDVFCDALGDTFNFDTQIYAQNYIVEKVEETF